MTPHQTLEAARAGELPGNEVGRRDVADAVGKFAEIGDSASAVELVGRTWRMWLTDRRLEEGSAVVAAALAIPRGSSNPWRVRALYADGLLAFRSGNQERSRASNEEALQIARQIGDVRGECDALTGLARVALRDGKYEEVIALSRHARARALAAGDREAGAGPLHLQAAGTRLRQDYRAARELYLESLGLNIELGKSAWVSMELHNLGWVELHLGNIEAAKARFHERDATPASDAYGNAWTELNWSAVAAAEGDAAEAQRRYTIGMRALESLAVTPDPDDRVELEWLKEHIRA